MHFLSFYLSLSLYDGAFSNSGGPKFVRETVPILPTQSRRFPDAPENNSQFPNRPFLSLKRNRRIAAVSLRDRELYLL